MKRRAELRLLATLLLPAVALAQGAAPAIAAPLQTADATAAPPHAEAATPAKSSSKDKGKDKDKTKTKNPLGRLPSAADLRPTGPVTIKADRAEMVQNNWAVYTGNVTLDSDTVKMNGDRLELKRTADGPSYTAKVTGAPAHMSHAGNGPDNPPVSARANTMTYDSRSGIIDLVGDAMLTRGDDQTTAETIHYHVQERRYEASGGDSGNGRVTIILPQANAIGVPTQAAPSGGDSAQSKPSDSTPPAKTPKDGADP